MVFPIIILVFLLKIKVVKLNILNFMINFYKFDFIGKVITLSIFVLFLNNFYDNIYYFMYFLSFKEILTE